MKANPLTDDVKITVRKPEREATFAAPHGSAAVDHLGYPLDWPKCPTCGEPTLDGHRTCGRIECGKP